ncbi:hypothetical protein VOLCADRAFT_85860 [Volvox carteri f. nagariensis]|uniref:RAP domain-containing protein n=1 Tax=Volvox carteri f. nagariensis TaxID=3068 RepID=D8TH68_VOLCA|nr:uncharacterized protein VOLCADRAFT_85860 [Volvox carteri f. nagariensis]EFJ52659.1 hypothetical protein VOLCADRAFT_85860 [Volvox carteri f. nagariensis]|eukprot:XP_002945664.1 hypothetical protein VOLCADRAFT_85860 [Volvox carteri f. nagariensis]
MLAVNKLRGRQQVDMRCLPPPTSLQHRTALTRAITSCPTYTRLHQLILENAADFNCYHTCAALSRVLALHGAGLTPRESRLFKEGCSMLQTILRRQVSELQPRALVVAAYSLARLELPDRELLGGLAAAVEPHLSALQPQGLSSLLWAFARQSHQPSPKWMDALLSAAAADLATFSPRDMATLLWALARLHYKVAPARLKQLLEHAQNTMGSYSGRSLSNVVYSLALSQQHPGEPWLEAAQRRAVELGPEAFTPQGITQMAWGIAKLGSPPSPAFLELVLEHASQRLPLSPQERQEKEILQQQEGREGADDGGSSDVGAARSSSGGSHLQQRRRRERYSGLDLATLLYSLASLGAQPRADLGRRLLAAVQWELPTLEANGMCNCLWACARLRIFPTKMWLSAFFDASYRQLPYFKPVDLSQTLWALARLQAAPPPAWVASVMVRLQHSATMFSPVEVATTMWALAKLGVRGRQMPGEVLALFFIATDRRLSSFKPQELCSMILALAHMRRRPDKEWAAEFLKVTYHRLASMSGWCLATVAWSLAELSLMPPPAWIYSYVNAARALLNVPAPPPPVEAGAAPQGEDTESVAGTAVASLSAMDLGQIITALRRLNGGGGGGGLAKVDEFLREAEERLAAMEAGSGAYARQQLGAFLAMSPEQASQSGTAGARVLVPPMVSELGDGSGGGGVGSDLGGREPATAAGVSDGGGGGGSGGGGRAGLKGPRVKRRRQRLAAALDPDQSQLLHHGERRRRGGLSGPRGKKRVAAAAATVGRAGGEVAGGDDASGREAVLLTAGASSDLRSEFGIGVAAAEGAVASAMAAPPSAAAAAALSAHGRSSSSSPRQATRVRSGGPAARVTLAAPPPDVHVDLGGELNVELSVSPSGPALWRSSSAATAAPRMAGLVGAAGGPNGDGNGPGNGSGNGVSGSRSSSSSDECEIADGGGMSMAEIKRRLLAV